MLFKNYRQIDLDNHSGEVSFGGCLIQKDASFETELRTKCMHSYEFA